MPPQLDKLMGRALDFLFPQRCAGCGKEGALICATCYQLLLRITPPLCPRCGRPQPSGILCPSCINWQSQIDGIRSPFKFEGVIRQAIHQLKYKNIRSLAKPLSVLILEYLAINPLPGEAIIPVPLHPRRLRERGYNQSQLIAEHLGKSMDLPVVIDYLVRTRSASPQARTASVEERRQNVAGAFVCQDRHLDKKQVLLIDDVSTSGATMDACAAALKLKGATSVWGIALAREI